MDNNSKQTMKESIKQLRDPDTEKFLREITRYYRISFHALKAEGFTETQAMDLLKARGALLT